MMVLFAIVGELGAGKTLSLVYLGFTNWFYKKEKIFSNIHLYKFPYVYVNSVENLRHMENGYVILDELWSILKSRCSMSRRNRVVGDIILRSRKLNLTYVFTSQLLSLIDKNIREITDFVAYPVLNARNTTCMLSIFRGSSKTKALLKTIYFKTEPIFELYDTNEIVDMVDEGLKSEIRFQENRTDGHPRFCECEKCGGIKFKSWEEAEEYANEYWYKLYKKGFNFKF
jgi:hypothetical protein